MSRNKRKVEMATFGGFGIQWVNLACCTQNLHLRHNFSDILPVKIIPVSTCYTPGRIIFLFRGLYQPRPLQYNAIIVTIQAPSAFCYWPPYCIWTFSKCL